MFWWIAAYLFVSVLTFVGLVRRLEPLDIVAFLSVAAAAILWPVTLALG